MLCGIITTLTNGCHCEICICDASSSPCARQHFLRIEAVRCERDSDKLKHNASSRRRSVLVSYVYPGGSSP